MNDYKITERKDGMLKEFHKLVPFSQMTIFASPGYFRTTKRIEGGKQCRIKRF